MLSRGDRFLIRVLAHPAAPLVCGAIVAAAIVTLVMVAGIQPPDIRQWRP